MYYVIVIFILLSMVFYSTVHRRSREYLNRIKQDYLTILFVLLALVMGLRDVSVGVDTANYEYIFNYITNTPFESLINHFRIVFNIEIGFMFYMKFISIIWSNYNFYLFVSAFIFCFLAKKFIEGSTNNYFVASIIFISIGIYLGAFNIYRQMLAVMLLANGWIYFKESRYLKTVIFTLLAISFHTTSILFIYVYIIYLLRNNDTIMKLLPILGIVVYISFELFLDKFSIFLVQYNNYLDNHKVVHEANNVLVLWFIEVLMSFYLIYKSQLPSTYRFIGNMSLMYVTFNLVGLRFNYIERFGFYFAPFIILLFCSFMDIIKSKRLKNVLFVGLSICFIVYFILSTLTKQYIYSSPFI